MTLFRLFFVSYSWYSTFREARKEMYRLVLHNKIFQHANFETKALRLVVLRENAGGLLCTPSCDKFS